MELNRSWTFHPIFILFLVFQTPAQAQVDLTRQPGGKGTDVVNAVVDIIRHSCVFPDDRFFLRRLAFMESQDGLSGKTYRPGYDGGIWQVDRDKFNETQRSPLAQKYQTAIEKEFGIDWANVTWSDLRKPLYSGIAADLYIQTLGTPVPLGIEDQGTFWAKVYESASVGLSYNFTVTANLLKEHCEDSQKIDLLFILDGSSSISPEEFDEGKEFVLKVIDVFDVGENNVHVAVMKYDADADVMFYLNSFYSKADVIANVRNITWESGTSNTAAALNRAVDEVFTAPYGGRDQVPKAIILFSDGQSDDYYLTKKAAARAQEAGINVFAIGVGVNLDLFELKTVASDPDCTHLFLIDAYSDISKIKQEIQHASCRVPIVLQPNEEVTCGLTADSRCIVQSRNVSNVQVAVNCSTAQVYTSYTNPYPGRAYYESTLFATVNSPASIAVDAERNIYISVQGTSLDVQERVCSSTLRPGKPPAETKLICREDGVDRNCTIPGDLLKYKPQICKDDWWTFNNPCTLDAVKNGQLTFPHPSNDNMYLTCDLTGKVYVVVCPQGHIFDHVSKSCGLGQIGNRAPNQTTVDYNPCTAEQLFAGHFFFPYPGDGHKFIHCDGWGHPWIIDCPNEFIWDHKEQTCVHEFLIGTTAHPNYNPCTPEAIANGRMFHAYPDDNLHYIRCDAWGEAFVMPCDPGTIWNEAITACVRPAKRSTATESDPQSPCTRENVMAGRLFFAHQDPHKYIHCAETGMSFVQSCGQMYFDQPSGTCVTGPVHGIVG